MNFGLIARVFAKMIPNFPQTISNHRKHMLCQDATQLSEFVRVTLVSSPFDQETEVSE